MLLAGASHTGKTVLAQRILERYHVPSLSVDHLKMGLIRSGHTGLTPTSEDEAITALVWPILREMIKTVIENRQQLVVEGCYIPFDWAADFSEAYRREIRYLCLILSDGYIRGHFREIMAHANDLEQRLDDSGCTQEGLLRDNARALGLCREHGCRYLLVEEAYQVTAEEAVGGCFPLPPAGPAAAPGFSASWGG